MSKKIKIGVVGCGFIAQLDYFPVMMRDDMRQIMEVTAVCDNVEGRAEAMCKQYGFKGAYTSFDKMLEEADIDLVAILTPIPLHYQEALDSLNAGKHVYVQKTMTTTAREAIELSKLAKEKKLMLCASPGQMVISHHQEAKKMIDSGKLGKICFVRGQGPHMGHENQELLGIDPSWYYQPGGGPLMDVAVYPLTSITGLIGPAKRVTAFSGVAIPNRYWEGKKLEVNVDDNTVMLLDFGDSVFASVQGNFVSSRFNTPQVELFGSKGVIQIGGWTCPEVPLEIYSEDTILGSGAGWYRPVAPVNSKPQQPMVWTMADLAHMVNCLLENQKPYMTGEHAAHVIEIIEKAYASARTGSIQELSTTFEPYNF